ncbi:MAG TPA: hypothetical protein DCE41_27495 [Cytophagales bacterium]|nr:hypothetical protein [Cytophagales bacterium]HAA21803.1 hypothetical protein [Cytophagales bacterium]HAP59280.1 hypothetical protein [Cytophagales bacterium]
MMAISPNQSTVRLADLQKTVEQFSVPQQQEVLELVQELLEGEAQPSPEVEKAQIALAQERINRVIANPETVIDAQAWLKAEREMRG